MARHDTSPAPSEHERQQFDGPNALNENVDKDEERGAASDHEKQEDRGGDGSSGKEILVAWDENDKMNPQNWTTLYKCWITFQLGMLALAASLGSSIISPANATIGRYVGVSNEVTVLNVSLYM